MRAADLPQADRLRQIAGWNQTLADWQRFLDLAPNGCFVAEVGEEIAGTVTTIRYGGEVGWIGMLLVNPDARGHGIGRALLTQGIEYLQSERIPTIKLDATPAGEGLYRKIGFREQWKLTRFKGTFRADPAGANRNPRQLRPDDVGDVIALDAQAFGVTRDGLLKSLVASAEITAAEERRHSMEAFGLFRRGSNAAYLGPVVSKSKRSAAVTIVDILERATAAGDCTVYWDIPLPNKHALALAAKLEMRPERDLLRMHLGEDAHPGEVTKYFAIADPALG